MRLRTRTFALLSLAVVVASACRNAPGGRAPAGGGAPGDAPAAAGIPKIVVSPSALEFGERSAGAVSRLPLTVRNVGDGTLAVRRLAIDAPPDAGYSVDERPFVLPPGGARVLEVAYQPPACASTSGKLLLDSNDPVEGMVTVGLTGRSSNVTAEVTPTSLDFGNVPVGATADRTLAIRNTGREPLTVTGAALAAQSAAFTVAAAPSLPLRLLPGARAELAVRLAPRAAGAFSAALRVEGTFCGGALLVPLAGSGTLAPVATLEVTPRRLDFGDVMVGRERTLAVTLRATGTLPVTVSALVLSGAGAPATPELTVLTSPGFALQPGRSVNVRVSYAPRDVGRDGGTLGITSNASDAPEVAIDLTGSGTPAVACDLAVSLGVLSFRAPVGGAATLGAQLSNTGNAPCTLTNVYVVAQPNGAVFSVDNAPSAGATLAVGAALPLRISYRPSVEGNHAALLRVTSNDANGGPQIRLLGAASAAQIEVLPPTLDFGDVSLSCASPTASVSVWNLGTAPLTFLGAHVVGGASSPFRVRRAPPPGTVIPGGGSIAIELDYAPTSPAPHEDVLEIRSSDARRNPVFVPLRGTGTVASEVVDTFVQSSGSKVDLLFVVDDSESMGHEQENLRTNLAAFVAAADAEGGDYQLGVITTDVVSAEKTGKLQGAPRIVRGSDPAPRAEFLENAVVGTSGSNVERGLLAIRHALTSPNLAPGGVNEGFLRKDADLEVIVLSDEEDQSPGTPAFYAAALRALKGSPDRVRLSAIVGPLPTGCRSAAGMADPGARYLETATLLSGVTGSICDDNFARTLADVAARAFALRDRFRLSRQPEADTLRVTVDEREVARASAGWRYDAATNEVVFAAAAVPRAGAEIVIRYRAACIPR